MDHQYSRISDNFTKFSSVMNSSSPLEHFESVIDMEDDAAKEIANNNQASELNVQLLMDERLLT